MCARRVTLLTDFGTADGYVAAMKGVIASICADAPIDDVAHDVPRGDVAAAAWALAGYWRHYPPDTVHLIVVDPGVGSTRRPLAACIDDRFFVAPDNGLLSRVLDEAADAELVELDASRVGCDVVSNTFHGRDLFAPAAARLAVGAPLASLGEPLSDPVRLHDRPARRATDGRLLGEAIHVDRFGNVVTNIPATWVTHAARVRIDSGVLPLRRTYADVDAGGALALVGSRGLLEISVRDGDAASVLRLRLGDQVEVLPD